MTAKLSSNGKWTISNLLMSLSLFLLSFWFIYLTNAVLELEKFAAVGDRFTSAEASAMEQRIRSDLPPEWLLDRLERIETKIERHHP